MYFSQYPLDKGEIMLKTSSEVIDALGGTQTVSALLNVGASAISNYRKKGFPARAAFILARQCESRALSVSPTVFGMPINEPDQMWRRQATLSNANRSGPIGLFKKSGFRQIETSILQPADPFIDLLGEEMRRRLFTFEDPRGETLCLRPDLTIPTARAYIEANQFNNTRLCYDGTAFRYQPRGAGKPEEFTQIGIEILNGASKLDDEIEIVSQMSNALGAEGVNRFDVYLNDLSLFEALLNDLALPERQQTRLMRSYAHGSTFKTSLNALSQPGLFVARDLPHDSANEIAGRSLDDIQARYNDKRSAANSEPLSQDISTKLLAFSALNCAADRLPDCIEKIGISPGKQLENAMADFAIRCKKLEALVPQSDLLFSAARGRKLAYYTGFIFEICVPALGPRQVIASGGRYDALLAALNAPQSMPAVGAAMAYERVKEAAGQNQ